MNELYAILYLIIFLLGTILGCFITVCLLLRNEVSIEPVYVDDGGGSRKKRGIFIRKRKKNEEEDDDDGILGYRLVAEKSVTEQKCEVEGSDVSEVLQEQQKKVDGDFEYLALNIDTQVKNMRKSQ